MTELSVRTFSPCTVTEIVRNLLYMHSDYQTHCFASGLRVLCSVDCLLFYFPFSLNFLSLQYTFPPLYRLNASHLCFPSEMDAPLVKSRVWGVYRAFNLVKSTILSYFYLEKRESFSLDTHLLYLQYVWRLLSSVLSPSVLTSVHYQLSVVRTSLIIKRPISLSVILERGNQTSSHLALDRRKTNTRLLILHQKSLVLSSREPYESNGLVRCEHKGATVMQVICLRYTL